eukprot:4791346-Amphidinium_carterae.1
MLQETWYKFAGKCHHGGVCEVKEQCVKKFVQPAQRLESPDNIETRPIQLVVCCHFCGHLACAEAAVIREALNAHLSD